MTTTSILKKSTGVATAQALVAKEVSFAPGTKFEEPQEYRGFFEGLVSVMEGDERVTGRFAACSPFSFFLVFILIGR